MRRLRSVVLGAAVGLAALAPVLAPAATGATAACAATAGPHAGLVVDTGGHATSYCVALDASSVSGIHLIELAGQQYSLQYHLGFGGQAVCQLAGVGPDGDDCFGDFPSFWGYWHGSGDDGWSWATTGAGSASISDGERDGWSWGTGASGATHAAPPAEGIDAICASSSPSPSPSPTHGGGGGSGHGGGSGGGHSPGAGGQQSPKASPSSPSPRPEKSPTHRASPRASDQSSPPGDQTSGTGDVTAAAVGANANDSGGGPPLGAALAAGAVLILVAAGALRLRARSDGRA
jgi:hypothetical protein